VEVKDFYVPILFMLDEVEVEFYLSSDVSLLDCAKLSCIYEQYELFEVDDIQIAFLLLLLL
jgi:hypothetical protein